MYTTNIRKWGNSQGLYIPVDFLRHLGININDSVTLDLENGAIIIRRDENLSAKEKAVRSLRDIRERSLLNKTAESTGKYDAGASRDYRKEYEEYLDERYGI